MSDIRVASRYAKSVFDLANEHSILEEVHNDMVNIKETIKGSRDLEVSLKSPIINPSKKLSILNALFGNSNDLTKKFFTLVVKKRREADLFETAKQFHVLYNSKKGIEMAEIITPFELTDDLRTSFKEKIRQISGQQGVELTEKIDKTLLGGFILNIEGKQIDESVRTRLQKIEQSFAQ
ncbi:ATP synthase F1 subcomplex delta subunit [Bernardetia litoralis DSM 6794]|uniref:ATP synthase subunit delta n=1 Tax=Bernardetia litoralis (strain ATCC 23117 / DSM 6794 / NBRC 15988 / NCIMB 1366 / Fx l1 / Sio-4) TaxID=880071 RepID=I4AMY7_BERLS|nr:ATP synthase F1 subunit delta [Bernardetia litoralis]AFM05322.1 ATP synthase F1 subcomplex delta subunit [Bernardetia litoralis DSM 6794]